MHRLMSVVALAALLVGCTGQETAQSDEPTTGSAAASADAPGGDAGSPSGEASAACAEAFAPIAELEVTSLSDLGDVPDEVQPTIASCESVADWIAGAQTVIDGEISPNTAAFLLRMNCEEQALASTPICEELASS